MSITFFEQKVRRKIAAKKEDKEQLREQNCSIYYLEIGKHKKKKHATTYRKLNGTSLFVILDKNSGSGLFIIT